jgi:succinate dehydrogenase flavin-adding protein (antitoxin of CptAB toxin-antitoxin module)
LASFLIRDIGAFHDFVNLERLLAERDHDIFSIIQHDRPPEVTK